MDLRYGEKYDRLREEVRSFVRENWPLAGDEAALPPHDQAVLFRKRAIAAGFLAPTVPTEYGGGGRDPDVLAETVIRQELVAAKSPWRAASPQGTDMLVPTLLEEGTPEQCRRYIPQTLLGELIWCQGYSEPGSGSDLGSIQSRAVLDGDHWVLNGQKIWTSSAQEAQMMFGLFRTEPDQPRSRGISYLLVDMKAPGIEVRPLTMMTGGIDFCEVFFDDVRIPADSIVGKRGEGWKVSKATLKHERMLIGDASYLQMAFDDLLALAKRTTRDGRPVLERPGVRQRLAEIEGFVATQTWASHRMLSAIAHNQDMSVINEMMMTKLSLTNSIDRIARMAVDLLAEAGLTAPTEDEGSMAQGWKTAGDWVSMSMMSLGLSIAGGTSNIQRNIIGERVLGLPRDLRRSAS